MRWPNVTQQSPLGDGIVIRTYPCGEADLVVRLMTKGRGKLALYAKSARKSQKRFGSGVDLFDSGSFKYSIRESTPDSLGMIEEYIPAPRFRALRDSFEKLSVASLLCECCDLLTPEQGHAEDEIFEALQLGLRAIEEAEDLKEALRGCYLAIYGMASSAGVVVLEEAPAPSRNSLLKLISTVSRYAERPVMTKSSVLELLSPVTPQAGNQ